MEDQFNILSFFMVLKFLLWKLKETQDHHSNYRSFQQPRMFLVSQFHFLLQPQQELILFILALLPSKI